MASLPKKIAPDPIAEAIFEVRFTSKLEAQMPELVMAELANNPEWRAFKKVRLPIADLPMQIRMQDPNLLYQPMMELQSAETKRIVKLGHNVVSYHALAPYPGWTSFRPALHQTIGLLFDRLEGIEVTRLGLRYINLFRHKEHSVKDIRDLYVTSSVAGTEIGPAINLTYLRTPSERHKAQVRMASPDYISGPDLSGVSMLVDVDVFTPDRLHIQSFESAIDWLEAAHDVEKTEFFTLFTDKMKKELVIE